MPVGLILNMIIFATTFSILAITSLITFLKSRKKMRTLHTESYAYIVNEFDYGASKFVLIISIIGIFAAFMPLAWSVY